MSCLIPNTAIKSISTRPTSAGQTGDDGASHSVVPKPGDGSSSSPPLRRAHGDWSFFGLTLATDMEPIIARLRSGHGHGRSPFVATAAKRLTSAAKNNAILKISIVASVLLASSGVGYYYLVYLPQREVQFEPQRVLERFRAAAEKRAEQRTVAFRTKGIRTTSGGTKSGRRAASLGEGQPLSSVSKPCDGQLQHLTVGSLQSSPRENHQRPGRLREVGFLQKRMRDGARHPRSFAKLYTATDCQTCLGRRLREST